MPPPRHFLHIDDDEGERFLFSQAFFKSGVVGVLHSLSSASNALLYLDRKGPFAGAPRPHVIVLDLHLPRSEGRQLQAMLMTDQQFNDIAIVILTGPQNDADLERCRALGIDSYRKKPRNQQECIELIRALDREQPA